MNKLLLITLAASALVLSGCSSKQYFEPEQTYSASSASSSYGSTIVDLSRDGATLKNGQYIGKNGISSMTLGEGYRFLSESSAYVLAGNAEGVLKVIDKSTGEPTRAVSLHVPIVAATIHQGLIAYILNNNTFGIYQIKDNKKIVENRSERTFAIDTRAASPMFIDSLAVMPMLDGKLIIFNTAGDIENAKVVYLSSEKIFNNVVLVKLDDSLQPLAKKKFKYAHFSVSTAFGGRVFALDQEGSLIVLSADLSKYKIYDLGEVDTPAFITGTKLYKDGKVIELSKLGYE